MALLQNSVWQALFRSDAGCGPIVDVDSTLSHSDHIAFCFLELERLSQELKGKLRNDILNILSDISNISLTSTPKPPSPPLTPPSRSSSLIHGATFITEAYSWLLENITNPYPSPAVKESLAQRYNHSLSTINYWFVNARRRTGWTALCRDYFNSCRADALDAAHRALVEEDPNRPLPANIIHAFISVKATTEEHYSSTLTKSTLADSLDAVVKDIPAREGVFTNEQCNKDEEAIEVSKASDMKPQIERRIVRNCYPSPTQPSSSPVLAVDEYIKDRSDDEDVQPPTLAGRKRRFSSSEGAHISSESTTGLVKRSRPNLSYSVSCANNYLPSPPTCAKDFSGNNQVAQSAPINEGETSIRRKHRLSHADTARMPQRSRGPMVEPQSRPHTVSHPFLLSALESERSIDEWFKTNFDTLFSFPPPVDVTGPDHSTQWEVKLFNSYSVPEDFQKESASSIQGCQASSSKDLVTLEDILQYFESGRFVTPSEIAHPPTVVSALDLVSQVSLLPDVSQPINWTLLNEDPRGSIDLSIVQLPQV